MVKEYLTRIEKNKGLNAFLEVFEEEALERASVIDKKIQAGDAGKLAGIVIGLKDNLCYKDHEINCSSKILEGFISLYSATAVERLLEQDAIIIGRLNCDEFAMGSTNENSAYGNVLHPMDNTKVPGGSSGGAAVAVKAEMCTAALGTDTGGSVRQPASLCGIIGFKPTYGRISRYGLIAYASSFDQIGVMSNSVDLVAQILEVISGSDEYDSTCSSKPVDDYANNLELAGKLKIAYFTDCIDHPSLDKEIKSLTEELIASLKKEGHTVEPVSFPYVDFMVPAYYVLTNAEASSNLARYDGVKFGYRNDDAEDLESTYKKTRSEGFGTEVKRRIMLGTFVLSAGYYDAYYAKAQKVRRIITDKTKEILDQYEFIITPTSPTTAFGIGEKTENPISMYLSDIFTVHGNLTGLPVVSLPLWNHSSDGLPIGLQVLGNKFSESRVLAFSEYLLQRKN